MSHEQTAGGRYIGANVQVGWGKLSCEFDPEALAGEMSKHLSSKLVNSCPEAAPVIPELAQAVARRGVRIFFLKLPDALQMFAGALLTEAISAAYAEMTERTLPLGARSQDVHHIKAQLQSQVEDALIQGHRHLWGAPDIGRPPKSVHEKTAAWTAKREDLISRYTLAIIELIKGRESLKRVNIARLAYPEIKKKESRQATITQDVKKYQIDLNALIEAVESEEEKSS
jgi:hypothetical protein